MAVDAACVTIAERGWQNARFSDVAAQADVSIGSLQYLFGTRDNMIATALGERAESIFVETQRYALAAVDPVERLRRIATSLVSGTDTAAEAGFEWLVWTEYWRAALRNNALRDVALAGYQGWFSLARDAIDAGVLTGQITAPADSHQVATSLVAMGDGLGVQVLLGVGGLTWHSAGQLLRTWLADTLSCPSLA